MPALLKKLDPVDLVLVEGYRTHAFPKLEVHRPSLAKPPIWIDMPNIIAVASDSALDIGARTLLPLNAPEKVAIWILDSISRFHGDNP